MCWASKCCVSMSCTWQDRSHVVLLILHLPRDVSLTPTAVHQWQPLSPDVRRPVQGKSWHHPHLKACCPDKATKSKIKLKTKDKCPIFEKKNLALAVALVRSAIPYSQLSSSDWTLGPTLVVVLSLVLPLSPSPHILSSSTLESVLSSVALLCRVLSYITILFSRKWCPNILPPSCSFSSLSLLLETTYPLLRILWHQTSFFEK